VLLWQIKVKINVNKNGRVCLVLPRHCEVLILQKYVSLVL